MTLDDFRKSLAASEPPAGLTNALAGLWWDGKGDWKRAHESAQQDEGVEGSWVHAYLHRKEGDQANAGYWYSRAGKPVCREPLDAEWVSIVRALLGSRLSWLRVWITLAEPLQTGWHGSPKLHVSLVVHGSDG